MKRTRSERDKEVSAMLSPERGGLLGDLARETRAELPAPLPAPSEAFESADPLGEPLTIGQVGKLIGCSAWTVRQKYVPAGLPHLRSGPNGKLIFYKNQVIHWLLERQRKGAPRT